MLYNYGSFIQMVDNRNEITYNQNESCVFNSVRCERAVLA